MEVQPTQLSQTIQQYLQIEEEIQTLAKQQKELREICFFSNWRQLKQTLIVNKNMAPITTSQFVVLMGAN